MLKQTYAFVENFLQAHPVSPDTKVLDVGSRDVNGSIRPLFAKCKYTGIDFIAGPNVDIALNGHDIKKHFTKDSFDIVLTMDTLEHDFRFWEIVENMRWVLKPGGWFIITVPSINHPLHEHPNDCYRFFDSVFEEFFFKGYEEVYIETQCYFDNNETSPDEICGFARKPK